jgi:hypothetical protein
VEPIEIAELCHEVNRAYCASIGDHSQPSWNDAPEWQKASAINGVMIHLGVDNMTPEDSHNIWLSHKRAEGWSWGPVKDVEKKEHPCFIEYYRLPIEQRSKDYIFKAVCDFFKNH